MQQAAATDGLSPEHNAGRIEAQRDVVSALIDTLVERTRGASGDGEAELTRQRLVNALDQWVKRRKHLGDLQQSLVYERGSDGSRYDALLTSPENARSRDGSVAGPPFVVANSMREVQPEINLLVSPIKENLFYIAPPGTPAWEFPAEETS